MILETYTGTEAGHIDVPDFLTVSCEVTDQPLYSMYNLCLKDYHQMEVKAGVTQAVTQFDYRQAYADIEADGTESSSMRSNGLH